MNLAQEWFAKFYGGFIKARKKDQKLGLNVSRGEWTQQMMDFLKRLGERQRYQVSPERLGIDQLWKRDNVSIAIEHEIAQNSIWRKELPNLIDVTSDLKVLITYVRDYNFPSEPCFISKKLVEELDKKYIQRFKEFLLIIGTKSPQEKGKLRDFMHRETDWFARRFYVGAVRTEIIRPSPILRAARAWESKLKSRKDS